MKVLRERTEILLMEYASGSLDEACSLLAASYITLCPEARQYYRECEALGGALMEGCKPVAMHGGSMQAILGRLDEECAKEDPKKENCSFCEKQPLPSPIANMINDCGKKAKWRKKPYGAQYYICPVSCDTRHKTVLVKMGPGTSIRAHSHIGTELTLVLEGNFHDEFGEYREGDLVIIDEPVRHRPVAGPQGCLCLIVNENPVSYTGTLGRILSLFPHW